MPVLVAAMVTAAIFGAIVMADGSRGLAKVTIEQARHPRSDASTQPSMASHGR
jgi:hypothetical protein